MSTNGWAREWLESIRELSKAVAHDEAALSAVRSRAGHRGRSGGGGKPSGGGISDPTSSEAMSIVALEGRAHRSAKALADEVDLLDFLLGEMDAANPRHPWWSRAIRLRYVECLKDDVGAMRLGYGVSQYRLFIRCGIDWMDFRGPSSSRLGMGRERSKIERKD